MSLDGAPLDHISKCRNESSWEVRRVVVVLYYFFFFFTIYFQDYGISAAANHICRDLMVIITDIVMFDTKTLF